MMRHRVKPARPVPPPRHRLRRRAGTGVRRAERPQVEPAQPVGIPSATPPTAPTFEWLTAFDELEDPVFVHDDEFRILRCNPAYAAFAGQPVSALIGKPYWQIFPKLSGPLASCVEALHGEATSEKSELTASGGQVFLNHDITAHRRGGEFWYSRHLMENVTARNRDIDAGKRKSLLADAVFRRVPGVLMVVDQQRRLVTWNTGLRDLVGRSDSQLKGVDLLSLVVESERESVRAMLHEVFAVGRAEGHLRLQKETGSIEHCVLSAEALDSGGARYAACLCFGDSIVGRLESDLAREKAMWNTIIESAPGPYYVVDQSDNLLRWNSRLREISGLKDSQLLGTSVLSLIHEEDRPLAAAKLLIAAATGFAQMEVRMPTVNHGIRVFLKTARRFEVDGVPYVTGFCVDITERREMADALAREKDYLDALVNSVPGAFYVIDQEGNYCTWNSYLNRLTGLSDVELHQRSSLLTIEENDRPLAAATMKEAFDTGYAQVELHVLTRDRGVRLYFITARRFRVGDASFLVGVGMDTTDRGERMQRLEEEARTDALTHLVNRNHFLSLAAQEFARSRRYAHPLSLWMIDVDHFKEVNDTLGHHAGDLALQSLAEISRQMLRDWDVMGRLGGEEFAVLLPETDASQALLVAERLRQKVATAEVAVDPGASVHMTISIGVASMQDGDRDIERLLDRADQALLEAKRTGRDKVCVAEPGLGGAVSPGGETAPEGLA